MAATTTTTLTTVVPAEYIAALILQEARPQTVVAPLVYQDIVPGGEGKVYNRSQLPSTTAASVGESSDITATARTTTESSVTIAEVGLSTDLTDLSRETARGANTVGVWAAAHGRAIAVKVDGDLCGLFAALNSSNAVGTSGTNITVANFIEAIYTLDSNNAPGQKVCVLHPRQVADLFNAIQASTGTPWQNLGELVRDGRFVGGQPASVTGIKGGIFGVPVYGTTEVDAVNSSADRAGAMFVRDALMFIQGTRGLRAEVDRDASARITEVVSTIVYGVGEGIDTYGVPIETDA